MKFAGMLGFVKTVQNPNDDSLYTTETTEKKVYGEVLRDMRNNEKNTQVNDNFTISNQFSIVANNFCYHNFQYIKYLTYLGVKWRVTSVETLHRPRLIISVNGVYNDPNDQTYSGE